MHINYRVLIPMTKRFAFSSCPSALLLSEYSWISFGRMEIDPKLVLETIDCSKEEGRPF